MNTRTMLALGVLVLGVAALVTQIPEIRRELRILRM